MGKLVKLEASAGARRAGAGQRARRRSSKTALVLGGGGFTGGVYEIGALRALDLLSVNRTVNDFDVYVGTSAGSFVASAVANGITPEEMMRVVSGQGPTPFPDARVGSLLRPNYGEMLSRGLLFPLRVAQLLSGLGRDIRQISAVDVVLGLAEVLPTGLYRGDGIERYVREILSGEGRTDSFAELKRELYLAATDLDSCERVVFGSEGWSDVAISRAVSASSALPMIYRPVRIGDREYVDGGIVSTTNLDIAVHAGAKLIVVVNPLVPYCDEHGASAEASGAGEARLSAAKRPSPRRVSDMGFPQIGYQAFKLLAHQRLHEQARSWEERYPGVDIILIEPDAGDSLMFQTSMMNFSSRVEIARHGFRSVTLHLADDYPRFKRICARHGIEISATRVRQVVEHFATERESGRAWRKILEQTTSALLRQSAGQ
ncbi:MAG: patatin-like phospholipase family protein [Solirubrobacteraceae bacterium]